MNIWNTLPAYLALLISVVALWFQWRPNYVRLRMDITHLHVVQVVDNNYLVLLRLSLINNSSTGRVVYNILPVCTPETVTVAGLYWKFDLENQVAIYESSKTGVVTPIKIPISELLLPPLDVSPRQSVSKWVGLILHVPPDVFQTSQGEPFFYLYFYGRDIDGWEVVQCHRSVYPSDLKPSETYEYLFSQVTPKPSLSTRFLNIINNSTFILILLIAVILWLIYLWNQSH